MIGNTSTDFKFTYFIIFIPLCRVGISGVFQIIG